MPVVGAVQIVAAVGRPNHSGCHNVERTESIFEKYEAWH